MRNTFLVTNRNRFGFLGCGKVLFLFLLLPACFASSLPAGHAGQAPSPGISTSGSMMTSGNVCPTKEELIQKTRTLQMPFIANNGQVDDQVRFYAMTFGGTVFVTKEGEIVYALPDNNNSLESGVRGFKFDNKGMHNHRCRKQDNRASCIAHHASCNSSPRRSLNHLCSLNEFSLFNTICTYINTSNPSNQISRTFALKETLVGANILGIAGEQPAATTVNYFTGNDKSKWKTNVPTYNQVRLGEVYKGIELNLKAYGDNVEKLFCVKPGANPELIKVQLDGSKSLRVNQDGQLEANTELGPVKFTRPIAYQEIEGKRVEVECRYTIADYGLRSAEGVKDLDFSLIPHSEFRNPHLEYGFTVAAYDKTKDLIIDPLLASTFLGGTDYDLSYSLTIDTSGNVYVVGITWSRLFPTTKRAYDTSFNGVDFYDIFVSKLDSGLTRLLASTYLGGDRDDLGISIALDTSGNVYITGNTWSTNFPTTSGAYDTSYNGMDWDTDAFVSKLNSGLTRLLASTYLGGSYSEAGNAITIDAGGDVYVTGYTVSADFPITSGAYNVSWNGVSDVFVSKLDGGLASLLASTFLGGYHYDWGKSLTLDTSGNVYVAGHTMSPNFPATSGAYDTSFNNDYDVFVSKLDGGLTSLLASTYLGGSGSDGYEGVSLTLNTSGDVYVAGETGSTDFPTTSGAYNTAPNNGIEVFVSKLDSELTSLQASTFLGGSGYDGGKSIALDTSGNVYVTGETGSQDFPTTSGAYDTSLDSYPSSAFISELNSGLTSLLASTFLGGDSTSVRGRFVILDTSGNVYVTGVTRAPNFPTTSDAYDTSYNGYFDVFVSKLDANLSADDECMVKSIAAAPKKLTIRKNEYGDVTITVAGEGGCLVKGATVTATIDENDKLLIGVFPTSQKTDANEQAVFTIDAKDRKGTSVVKFEASGLNKAAVVRVKVR